MERLFRPVEWSANTNVYEVNLRQYTPDGTFAAFGGELPRLRDMGIEVIWFMPVTPISVEGRLGSLGSYYACSEYTSANPEFGTVSDFKQLVKQAHDMGFKVIIDWVANHTGIDHKWTKTHPEFYKRNAEGNFYDSYNWNDVIDLNYYDQTMRKEMIRSMEFWIKECDIDGFRCDMAHLVPLDFWRQARLHLDAIRPLFWLAETEDHHYQDVFDCSYGWTWMHRSTDFVRGAIVLDELKQTLLDYPRRTASGATHLFFTTNHDENSWNGTEFEKYGDAAIAFAVFSLTWSGIPLIYSGQEMPNHKRLKFFDKDTIEWTGTYELHNFYRILLSLRSRNPALRADNERAQTLFVNTTANESVLAYLRKSGDKEVLVLLNLTPLQQHLLVDNQHVSGSYTNVFTGTTIDIPSQNNFTMEPWGYLVLENDGTKKGFINDI